MLPAGDSEVTVLVDVAGALPSQLQGDGGQVFGRSLHDDATHHGVAGVDDVVEALLQQLLGLLDAARHHRVQLLDTGSRALLLLGSPLL